MALKWLILGKVKPGRYPMWGLYYYRCWLVGNILGVSETDVFLGSPLARWFCRLIGAKIGDNASLSSFDGADLVTVGENATIGNRVMFSTTTVTGDEFIVGGATIGAGANIGALTVLGRDCVIGENSIINALTSIPDNTVIPPNQEWDGSPVRFVRHLAASEIKVCVLCAVCCVLCAVCCVLCAVCCVLCVVCCVLTPLFLSLSLSLFLYLQPSAHLEPHVTPAYNVLEALRYIAGYGFIVIVSMSTIFPAFFFLVSFLSMRLGCRIKSHHYYIIIFIIIL